MTSYVIYKASGEIIKACKGADASLEIVNNVDIFLLECDFDIFSIDNMVVENGSLRNKTQTEIDAENQPFVLSRFKEERDGLLAASDWTQSPDSPLTDAKKTAWATYRQVLRDLPANTTDPANPVWPTRP